MTTIGIDIRMLAGGNTSGIEEYTTALLEHLLPIRSDLRFKLFYNGYRKTALHFSWLQLPQVELVATRFPNRLLDTSVRLTRFPRTDHLIGSVDKFFSPHIFLTEAPPGTEKIVTFHDLSFKKYPRFYSRGKNFWHWSMHPRRQAESANKIIAVSDSTKTDLVETYHIPSEKIRVIHSGLRFSAARSISETELQNVRQKYRLPSDFLLYLGTLEPRKNLAGLITAFTGLKKSPRNKNLKLVIAGNRGWLYETIFRAAAALPSEIIFTGPVDEADKPALYRLATVFIYPSFYEGFGFPPLEAMAQQTPVLTSATSSLPEIVTDAAVLINPYKPEEIRRALENLLTDAKLRAHLTQKGSQQIQKFNWQTTARETLEYILA